MLFDSVVVVLFIKYSVFVVGWLGLRPLPSSVVRLDMAVAFRRAAQYHGLNTTMQDNQVPREKVATYDQS